MTGIFIIARLGSTRLTQKHLIKVIDKTYIEWLVERYYFSFQKEINTDKVKLFIVTSTNTENKKFEIIFKNKNFVKIFYGSDENIPLRLYQCASANHIDNIISVDGDDILCSTSASELIINHLSLGNNIVKTVGLPLGMNVIGFKSTYLHSRLNNYMKNKLETGWEKIFNDLDVKTIKLHNFETNLDIRATLDYQEDSIFFENVIQYFGDKILYISDDILIKTIIEKEWYKINNALNEQYWNNFNKQKQLE